MHLCVLTCIGVKRLHRRLGFIVHVTHDQVEALTLADRILVLNAGVVQQVGSCRCLIVREYICGYIKTGSPSMIYSLCRTRYPKPNRGVDGLVP